MKKVGASPTIDSTKTKRKNGTDRMHYSKFACSHHHWTFEERKELERRWNENPHIS